MDRLPKLNPSIVEEASDWFIEFSEGSVAVAAREKFDAWLRRSPEHVQAYLKIAMLWEESALLGRTRVLASDELVRRVLAEGNIVPLTKQQAGPEPVAATPSDTTIGAPTWQQRAPAARRLPITRGGTSRVRIFAIAASLAVTAVAASIWLYVQRGSYSTTIGEQRSVRLQDGSTVDLNSQSKIRVRFSEHQRSVDLLEGQALFRVAKDSARPFIVATDNIHVRAVGTQFDIYRKATGTVVTVLEGRVAVLPERAPSVTVDEHPNAMPANSRSLKVPAAIPGGERSTHPPATGTATSAAAILNPREGEILLAVGEQITVTPQAVSQPQAADLSIATAWTQRKIAFKGAPLSEVVEEFNRYNTRQLVIVDPDLKTTKISGVFSSTEPDSLARFLRELLDISIHETGSEIRITRK